MSDLIKRLREHTIFHWSHSTAGAWSEPAIVTNPLSSEAADALEAHDAELAALRALSPLCEEHSRPGGKRAVCLVCACRDLSAALSRISYLCGEPNEMECGPYDLHCDENAVVEQVRAYCEQLRADAHKGD